MKIYIDDYLLYELGDLDKKCLQSTINKEQLDDKLREVALWHIKSFCDQARENLKKLWMPILFKRLKFIPTDDESLLTVIFSQPDYKDQHTKDAEQKAAREAKFKTE